MHICCFIVPILIALQEGGETLQKTGVRLFSKGYVNWANKRSSGFNAVPEDANAEWDEIEATETQDIQLEELM